jgi:hypothetical protein
VTASIADPVATDVRCDDENRWVTRGRGIHWDALDEDISVAGLLVRWGARTRRARRR